MSWPGKVIIKNLGFVEVHHIRVLKIIKPDEVAHMIEEVIEEVNEIAKARVEALGGNCLLGLKMDINTLSQTIQS